MFLEGSALTADMISLVLGMKEQMGRFPTEEEIHRFIFGDEATRAQILEGK